MVERPNIAGIVLAGGRSSRMGENKALLHFKGKPLVHHMIDILRDSGIIDIFVSGYLKFYPCIEDKHAYAGPALAIKNVLLKKPGYQGYLFIPVDMPLLSTNAVKHLLDQKNGGYFFGWPLPVYLTPPFIQDEESSVQSFLDAQGIYPLELPSRFQNIMKNANTPEEWEEVVCL